MVRASSTRTIHREIVWSGVKFPSLDYCRLTKETGGWRFSGTLVAKLQRNPVALRYEILVDKIFKTHSLTIEKISHGRAFVKRIRFRDDNWFVDGKNRKDLRECTDVDIEAT